MRQIAPQTTTQAQKIITIWDGFTWSQGEPTQASKVIFAANFTTNQNLFAQELEVLPDVKVTFTENAILSITKQFNVAKTAQLIFEDNSQLYNKGVTSPNAVVTIKRKTPRLYKYDYTYYCSPVVGQQLNLIGDSTFFLGYDNYDDLGASISYAGPRFDKYYYFDSNAAPDYYVDYYNKGKWQNIPETTEMSLGRGYIVRGPDSFATKQIWNTAFTGVANSGDFTIPVSGNAYTPLVGTITPLSLEPCNNEKFTPAFIGNPYPSGIDADSFLTNATNRANLSGTIALYSHNTGPSISITGDAIYNYTANDFVFYNLVGGIGTGRTNELNFTDNSNRPTGQIATCQGFFTKAVVAGATAAFTESMRKNPALPIDNEQFYRLNGTATIASLIKNRFWLSLQAGTAATIDGRYSETLVGYMPAATTSNGSIAGSVNTFDKMYDSELNNTFYGSPEFASRLEIYTIMNPTNTCPRLAIQGRKLDATFNTNDVVPIGFSCPSGTYTIRVEKLDGLFTSQMFWLRQTQGTTITYHDIRNNPFTFVSGGDADNSSRFAIVFKLPIIGIVQVPVTCGTTLQSMSQSIYSQQPSGGSPSYRFEVRSVAPFGSAGSTVLGELTVTTYQFNLGVFNTAFPGSITYNTTYFIRVSTVQVDGVWQYGASCTVTSSSPPRAVMSSQNCGSIINSYGTQLFCNQPSELGFTTNGYRFQVSTDPTFAFGTIVGLIVTNFNNITLGMLNTAANTLGNYQAIPNQDYFVRVQIRYSFPVANTWQVNNFGDPIYGAACTYRTGNILTRSSSNDFILFEVKAYPNPFATAINLDINTSSDQNVIVKTYDMIGRLIDSQEVLATEIGTTEIGNQFPAGVYNIIVNQGDNVKTLRVIKR